jgi:hypothetical protein
MDPFGLDPLGTDHALVERIQAIRLENPDDPREVRRYIEELRTISLPSGPTSARAIPLIREKMRSVGARNVPLLVEAVQRSSGGIGFDQVIADLATEEHGPLILDAFRRTQGLASAVVALGLEEEAWDTMLYWLRESGKQQYSSLHHDVVKVIAARRDRSTYPQLMQVFENSVSPRFVYELIQDLPAAELERSLFIVWRKHQGGSGPSWDRVFFARVLAERGKTEGLNYIFDELAKNPREDFERRVHERGLGELMQAALRVTNAPAELDRHGLVQWYRTQQPRLRYHPEQKAWLAPGVHRMRVWRDVEGREIEARFVSLSADGSTVTITRNDGRAFYFPMERLSEEDRVHVHSIK